MSETKPCKHCNGTTYCGARLNSSSRKLKVAAACTTCVAKSHLDPRVVYTKVVCSVCRGTGTEPEGQSPAAEQETSVWLYILVTPLMILALVLAAFGGIAYERASRRLQDEAERFQQEKVLRPEGQQSVDVIQRVEIGMDEAALKDELGEPDSIKPYEDSVPPLEMWTYRCRDKPVRVSLRSGKVVSVK
jgi:hypothetical protein